MKLIEIDPKLLLDNPENPRRTRVTPEADAALLANVREVGILQPPVARQVDDKFVLIAGHRRRNAAIGADLAAIHVLVREAGDDALLAGDEASVGSNGDGVRALAENHIRAQLGPVDQWRAIEALIGDAWNEDGIARALNLPVRRIRALRQLSRVHPKMLEQMARGDMPNDEQLRTIGLATTDEQAAVWKKNRPKKDERANWHMIRHALEKRRISYTDAKFGEAEAEAFGVTWDDDLFVAGGTEGRYTTQVEAFMSAKKAWLAENLPKRGVLLEIGEYGQPQLPPKAERVYAQKPGPGDHVGCAVNSRDGSVEQVIYRLPEPAPKRSKNGEQKTDDASETARPARPPLTQKGETMVGDLRTEALHAAFLETDISDQALIGLLVLALAGTNVSVRSGAQGDDPFAHVRQELGATITAGGVLSSDPDTLRTAARGMLRQALSCRTGLSSSGTVARYAGMAVDAERFLPTTATEEFLGKLSKAAIEDTARANGITLASTGKATRAAIIDRMKDATFLHPLVRFELTEEERAKAAQQKTFRSGWNVPKNENGEGEGDDAALDCLDEDEGTGPNADREAAADDEPGTSSDAPAMPPPTGHEAKPHHAGR